MILGKNEYKPPPSNIEEDNPFKDLDDLNENEVDMK